MSYRSVLARGFSVTRKTDGTILRSVNDVDSGQTLRTELADGTVESRTTDDGATTPEGKPQRDEAPQRQEASAKRTAPGTARKTKAKRRAESDEPMLFSMEED